ncbi:MAG: diaminopimelate epimerase [Actinomycetota bacterium]|nr:diaminopimelate epimerase [Actinomycetota bacterium]
MHLRKYHGLGNDFLVLVDADGKQPVDAALARAVCDRHRGAGADGFIRVTGHGVQGTQPGDPLRMELYNADGSRAETSGNGLRCLARAVVDAGVEDSPELTVVTDAGPRRLTLHDDGQVSVEMGTVRWDGDLVDLGNPHLVVFVDDLAKADGGKDGLNVEYVVTGPGADELTMRVFERGVGETLACGSGASAAAAVAHERGLVGERVTVHQPGGDVTVQLADPIVLTGPVEYICDVEWPEAAWR